MIKFLTTKVTVTFHAQLRIIFRFFKICYAHLGEIFDNFIIMYSKQKTTTTKNLGITALYKMERTDKRSVAKSKKNLISNRTATETYNINKSAKTFCYKFQVSVISCIKIST